MNTECYPITTLPNVTKLYRDYLAMGESATPVRNWYGAQPLGQQWMKPAAASTHADALANALERQSRELGAGEKTLKNIAKLRAGARAIVTGQQVGLLGGPLLTLNKAATAIARAKQATAATGVEHVPVFWLASEDHDIEEVDQVSLLTKNAVETLRLGLKETNDAPVGGVPFGEEIGPLLERASELLSYAPVTELLRECYGAGGVSGSGATFAGSFARLMTRLFAEHGLIVMDAAGRDFHTLGASALRCAIEKAEELETALLARSAELEGAGYHAQVLVKPGASLLFLISEEAGAKTRLPLKRLADGTWKAGAGSTAKSFTAAELLAILAETPERLSPNALLRPVFQDTILPTTAYVGGPAEVAYFAQSAVLYQQALSAKDKEGRVTPILPRMSATILEPAIAAVMAQHEVSLPDAMCAPEELAQRLGARAMPIEAKKKLAAAGNALEDALNAAQSYLGTLDAGLGQAAEVSASKMRYQMDRLRRLAATYELNKEQSLKKHADAMAMHLFPEGHPQERVIAGVWFVASWELAAGGDNGFIDLLVETAASQCPGHLVVRI